MNERQKAIAKALSKCPGTHITKVVHFTNDDVPKYLERLRKKKSRPSTIMIPTR